MSENPNSVTIVVPMVPPAMNELRRKYRNPYAYADLRKAWQTTIYALIPYNDRRWLEALAQQDAKMLVEICIENNFSRPRDPDNLVSSAKVVLDSLVRLRLLADDDDKHVKLVVLQEQSPERCLRLKLSHQE